MLGDWEIDILLSTPDHPATAQNKIFFEHLKTNANARSEYLRIKNAARLVSREHYLKAKKDFFERVVKEGLAAEV